MDRLSLLLEVKINTHFHAVVTTDKKCWRFFMRSGIRRIVSKQRLCGSLVVRFIIIIIVRFLSGRTLKKKENQDDQRPVVATRLGLSTW